jgi:N-methylhydantoinase B
MNVLNPRTQQARVLPTMPMQAIKLKKGDVFRHVSAGGGGFGAALDREPDKVAEDVREGKVSLAGAYEHYGVVIDDSTFAVDRQSTSKRRAAMRTGS